MKPILLAQIILMGLATSFLFGQAIELDVMNLNEKRNEGSGAMNFTSWGDWIYFSADDGVHGRELWAIGPEVTRLQADLDPGVNGSAPHSFSIVEDRLYFSARTGIRTHFFRIDEPGGVAIDLGPNKQSPTDRSYFQGAFYYIQNSELWRIHGETGLVELVATIGTRSAGVRAGYSGPQVLGNRLYFVVATQQNQVTLWRSDGTEEGTQQISVLYEEISSPLALRSVEMEELNGVPIIAVSVRPLDGSRNLIWNLWRIEEASLVKLRSGEANSRQRWFRHFQQVGNVGYFVSRDEQGERLFRTDGSPAGTESVPETETLLVPDKLTSHNGFLFFTSQEPYQALYRLDSTGNVEELGRFDDLRFEDRLDTQLIVGSDQRIYFFADAFGSAGTKLFRLEADGSDLASIYSGRGGELLVNEAGIFLTVLYRQQGSEIIKIDDSGVALVADINQTPAAPPSGFSGNWLTSFRDQIYYLNQSPEGVHLFRLEGETLSLFKTLESGSLRNLEAPRFFTYGDLLYLIFTDKNGQDHLWVTDGTVENTREVQGLVGETTLTFDLVGSNDLGMFLLVRTEENRQLWFLEQEGLLKKLLDLPINFNITDFFFPQKTPDSAAYPFLIVVDDALVLMTTDGTPANTKPVETLFDNYDGHEQRAEVFSGAGQLIIMVTYANGFDRDGLTNFDYRLWRFDESSENATHLIGDFGQVGLPGSTNQKMIFPVVGFEPTSLWEWLEIDRNGERVISVDYQVAPRRIIGASEESGLIYYADLAGRLLAWDGASTHLISEEGISLSNSEVRSLCGTDYLFHRQWLEDENRMVIDRVVNPSDGLQRISTELVWDLTSKRPFRANDGFYIAGGDTASGRELWRLDDRGLRKGTQLRTGPASANPFSMIAAGQNLYYLAFDDSLELKLWRERMPRTSLEIQAKRVFLNLYLATVKGSSDSSFLWRAENATVYGDRTSSRLFFFNHGGARLTVTQEEAGRCTRRGELTLPLKNHRGSQSASENTGQQPRKR